MSYEGHEDDSVCFVIPLCDIQSTEYSVTYMPEIPCMTARVRSITTDVGEDGRQNGNHWCMTFFSMFGCLWLFLLVLNCFY